jgi:alkylation response protein AidB-like acyl-CoA dehydrogenase
MEFTYPDAAEQVREKVQVFLAEQLPPGWKGIGALDGDEYDRFVIDWRAKLAAGGWLAVAWPEEYGGRGLTEVEQVVVAEEMARAGVPDGGPNDAFGISMLGNTLLEFGTEEQKRHFLPRILSGEYLFCQGYSEPNAGSDLANVGARAVRDGDEWVINGQKIWTSAGHLANWIFVLTRTDTEAPKHKGITFIMCEMDQPGIEVRPIRMMSGSSEFNEVFFTDARASVDNVVGSINDGWRIAMALLGFERGERAAVSPIQFRAEFDRLVDLARSTGRVDDPLIRDRIARAYAQVETMRYMGYAALTRFVGGVAPGPDAAITKIFWSEYHREVTELAMDILGTPGLVPTGRKSRSVFATDDPGAPNSAASWQATFLNARAGTIYAGTSEIQRNIVGEMILGLPKEPRPT